MALKERSRAVLFRGLSDLLDDEDAVSDLLGNFPTRKADEPATRDFVDVRIIALEARLDGRFSEIDRRFAELEARLEVRFAQVDSRFAQVDGRFAELEQRLMAAMHAETRTMLQWTIGSMIALVGIVVALGLVH